MDSLQALWGLTWFSGWAPTLTCKGKGDMVMPTDQRVRDHCSHSRTF